jgi:hypothetical protein
MISMMRLSIEHLHVCLRECGENLYVPARRNRNRILIDGPIRSTRNEAGQDRLGGSGGP